MSTTTSHDDARLECISEASGAKLTGEQRSGAGLLSSVKERAAEYVMAVGLVWLRVCEGR